MSYVFSGQAASSGETGRGAGGFGSTIPPLAAPPIGVPNVVCVVERRRRERAERRMCGVGRCIVLGWMRNEVDLGCGVEKSRVEEG